MGVDSFVYRLSQGGTESNTAHVSLTVTDTLAPSVQWLSPVTAAARYDLFDGEQAYLEVQVSDNRSVVLVRFTRWDSVNLETITIADLNLPPYRTAVSVNNLNLGWNQVNVTAFDQAGNRSDLSYIWLYRHAPGEIGRRVFMPLVTILNVTQ
jgi:hypothetical protein